MKMNASLHGAFRCPLPDAVHSSMRIARAGPPESVCVCVRKRDKCVCVCVCLRHREREREYTRIVRRFLLFPPFFFFGHISPHALLNIRVS